MSVFGDLEDNAPDGGWNAWQDDNNSESASIGEPQTLGSVSTPASAPASTPAGTSAGPAADAVPAPVTPSPISTQKTKSRLSVVITNIEINRNQDPIFIFDVTTNLPRFRSTSYRGIKRAHSEIRKFANHLSSATPESFVPVLPPPNTSFPGASPENAVQLKLGMQTWFNRITSKPLLARDEEFLYFVEYKSTYNPVVKIKPPATGLARKVIKQRAPPHDDVQELHDFRPVVKLIYQHATEAHGRVVKVARSKKLLAQAHTELSHRVGAMVQVETQKGMINMWTKLSKVLATVGDIESSKSILYEGYIGDALQMTARNAYAIKETLTNRHILMHDLVKCQTESFTRHETATRLKGANNISPAKVDEAITQLEDAKQLERKITSAVRRVTDSLVSERKPTLFRLEHDLVSAIGQFTLRAIEADRRILSIWESNRRDVRAVDSKGGLAKLGREGGQTRGTGFSQSLAGDSWSGDRLVRAKETVHYTASAEPSDEVIDARSAASLLSSIYE